ncbi:Ribosomal large subunit pseudouridine synthase B [hydrothermal vent metagenome]|uniref:Ribosomal large subunit pseudouridine synthase B n=1 Tax=hydrothermal vent metagenome TaxID=652676 RepID=A0A3B1DGZ2_9ZZZZ
MAKKSPRQSKQTEEEDKPQLVRLQKLLASAGYGSRRSCEEYVTMGRVSVNGKTVTDLATKIDPKTQKIRCDGELVKPELKQYFLVNKPAGYLCTNSDPTGRKRVVDLVPQNGPRLFTVGRLDEHSVGLILVTNDGEMAQRLAHPRYQVLRKYRVQVAGIPSPEVLKQLQDGVHFADGLFRCVGVKRVRTRGKSTVLEIALQQGQNREIRRLLAKVGHKVQTLERVVFGPLKLGKLAQGKCRTLRNVELKELRDLIASNPATPSKGKRNKKKFTPSGKRTPGKRTSAKRTSAKQTTPQKTKTPSRKRKR